MGAGIDTRELAVGRVYALALLGLAQEQEIAENVGRELAGMAEGVASDPAVAGFLGSPLVSEADRATVLETALRGRLADLTVDLLQVMNRKRRLALVPALAEAYRRELDRQLGRVDVEVASAVTLSEPLRERLRTALAGATRREPRLHERVDPGLVGGLVVAVDGRKIDASIAAHLRRLTERLFERAPRELAALME